MSITINGTTGISGVDGSSTTPAFQGTDTNTGLFYGTDIVGISTGGSERVRVDASGNVGIGTTSPANFLDISKTQNAETNIGLSNTSTGADAQVRTKYTTNSGLFTVGTTGTAHPYGGDAYIYQVANKGIRFATNDTERMRIDSSGNVGIGTSSPTYKLDISSGSSNTLNITTNNTNTTIFNITRSSVTTVTHTLDSTGYKIINGGSGGLYLGYTGTSWTSLSDERFKTDLKPIENAVEKVSTLRAVTGRFKTDDEDKSRAFLIAQDIQAVLPEAVDTSNPEQLGVSYTDTIPLLVAAIKEQQTIINDLKARVTALEASNV